jgi:RNA polymerase sigma-70 factor (ECF subfamily)
MDVENFKVFINIAVSLMPEQRRKVFVMSTIKEMTHKEIAESLGISVKTVEYHISKALASIREIMKNM